MGVGKSSVRVGSGELSEKDLRRRCKLHPVCEREVRMLRILFSDLSARSPGEAIDKTTFLQFFTLPVLFPQGLLGERLFDCFDRHKNSAISFDDLLYGLGRCVKGSQEERLRVLFSLYDLKADGYIDKVELLAMVISTQAHNTFRETMTWEKGDTVVEEITKESTILERKRTRGRRDVMMSSEFVESAVDRIMTCFDVGDSGQITYEEFKQVVDSNTKIMITFERCFHKEMWSVAESKEKKGACCHCFSPSPPAQLPSLPSVPDEPPSPLISKSGWTYKRLKGASVFDKIYLIQRGNILYEYSNPSQALPEALIFLEGCYIDPATDVSIKRAYGLAISHQHEKFQETVLFFSTKRMRDEWITALRAQVSARGFDQFFHLQHKIGMGKFSEVFTAVEKETGEIYAVKVIDKRILNELERELMRSELAILKLISHPHVVRLVDVFDERHKTYVVMDLVQGGELFECLRRKRVGEAFAQQITKQLLETVKYLHQFGIIHRDIKPENILISDHSPSPSIVLTDFGLSKLVGPDDQLQVPCGTLSYVAPEVLNMAGYNREVDIWSVGVVGFLMISGNLPFINKDKRVLMDMIKEGKVDFEGTAWAGVSADCLHFHQHMLTKDITLRLTAESALRHPWILKDPLTFPLSPISEQSSSKSPNEEASLLVQNHSDRVVSRPEVMSMVLDERGQVEGAVEVRLQTSKGQ